MIDFDFFQSLAEYANENWKGSFTESEVRENAETYLSDFYISNANGEPTETMKFLCENLKEEIKNGGDEALDFYFEILKNANGWEA